MINYNSPFPQADDFNKVLSIINIDNPEKLYDNNYLSAVLGQMTIRQISYYISACDFLGITNKRQFTEDGKAIRSLSESQQIIELAKIIFSDEIFSTLLFSELKYECRFDKSDVVEIMKKHIVLNSEEMYKRRASTVSSWTHWFENKLNIGIEN